MAPVTSGEAGSLPQLSPPEPVRTDPPVPLRPRLRAAVVLAALVVATLPGLASGTAVGTSTVRSVVLAADAVTALTDERLVGVTWTAGRPTVQVRWHSAAGWSAWRTAEDDTADSPEGTPGTEALWRPAAADRVQTRVRGAVRGLRLVRVLDGATRHVGAVAHAETGRAVLGRVYSRAEWGADESVRKAPTYASGVQAVVVHHTVNANGYAPNDVPRLIQADYAYHVKTRGWSDLGYNLLVDQFGRIWEGHYGGLGRATIGTHAAGFNTGTLGVAMLGDMTKTTASPAAEKALARVIAYAASTWHFDATGSVSLVSKGSPRFAKGTRVTLPRVMGHQQTGITACPGSLQDRLPALRALSLLALRPAPAIVDDVVSGAPVHAPTPMSLDARLTQPAAWRAVLQAVGTDRVVAATRGTGTRVHVEWDGQENGLPVPPGSYAWTVRADDGFHDATTKQGTFDVGLPFLQLG